MARAYFPSASLLFLLHILHLAMSHSQPDHAIPSSSFAAELSDIDGGIIVSTGFLSRRFEELMDMLPEARHVVVDARMIAAPRKEDRIPGRYPHPPLVAQVRSSSGFSKCVAESERVVREKGVVIVACKGGNHRAPTVAEALSSNKRHTVHLTLDHVSVQSVAILVGTCVGDGHLSKEYWCARRLQQPGQTSPDAYLGWHWCWRHLRIEGSNALCFGAHVRDVKPTDHENMVMVRADDGRYVFVHILWLLPDDVYRLHPECRRSAPAGAQ